MSESPTPAAPKRDGAFALFVALALAVAAFLVAEIRMRPPAPLGADAPPDVFSAARAERDLRHVFRDVPRPVGSAAHREARERLVERFREIGLDAQVERHWVVTPSTQSAAWVENVVARLPGTEPGPSVHVTSHSDSVPAGPGASDAAMCVAAVLETARVLRAGPPLRRGVVFLITDGEEAGLLGAQAHLKAHGTDDVLAVVNVEARGTTGPSLLFETGPSNAWATSAWKAGGPSRPVTSSLFAAVYRTMPNDTDLTVFRRAGIPGLNFACVGGVLRYHTPLDSFAHVDLRSLQHHGANVVAAVRGMAAATGDPEGGPDAMWHDVLGWFVYGAFESGVPRLALLAGLPLLALCVVRWRRRQVTFATWAVGVAAAVASLAAAAGCVWGLGALLSLTPALPGQFVASSAGAIAAGAGAAVLGVSCVALLAARWTTADGAQAGTWFVFAAAVVGLGFAAPWAAYLLLFPALAVWITDLAGILRRPWPVAPAACAGVAALGVIWFPLTPLLADALGVGPIPGLGAPLVAASLPFVVVGAALVPLLVGAVRHAALVAAGGLVVALAGTVVQIASDPFTPEAPQPLRLLWVQEDGSHAHAEWKAVGAGGGLPESLASAAAWADGPERVVPWRDDRAPSAEAPALDLRAPEIVGRTERVVDGSRRVTFRLRSARGAGVVLLAVDPAARLRRLSVGGAPVIPETLRSDSRKPFVLSCLTTPPEGVEFSLEFAGDEPVPAFVADVTFGLPSGADAILRARPADRAPVGWGDQAVVHRRVRL